MLCVLMSIHQCPGDEQEHRTRPLVRAAIFGAVTLFAWWLWTSAASADETSSDSRVLHSEEAADAAGDDAEDLDVDSDAAAPAVGPTAARPASSGGIPLFAAPASSAGAVVTPVVNAVVPTVIAPVVQPLAAALDAAVEPIVEPFVAPLQHVVVAPVVETAESMVQPVHQGVASLVIEPLAAAAAPAPPAPAVAAPSPVMPSFLADFVDALSVHGTDADHRGTRSRILGPVRPSEDSPRSTAARDEPPATPEEVSLPAPRPTVPLPNSGPGASSPAGSPTTARGGDHLQTAHGAVLNTRVLNVPSHSAVSTPVRATIAGASKNSGSRPAFTPD